MEEHFQFEEKKDDGPCLGTVRAAINLERKELRSRGYRGGLAPFGIEGWNRRNGRATL